MKGIDEFQPRRALRECRDVAFERQEERDRWRQRIPRDSDGRVFGDCRRIRNAPFAIDPESNRAMVVAK